MISFAKVSLNSVASFKDSIEAAVNYTEQLEAGIVCFSNFLDWLSDSIAEINDYIPKLESAESHAEEVISQTQAEFQEIDSRINEIADQIDGLRESVTCMEDPSEGVNCIDLAAEDQQSTDKILESQLYAEQTELYTNREEQQHRLQNALNVLSQIKAKHEQADIYISSLEEMLRNCRQLHEEYVLIKNSNFDRGERAKTKLAAIEHIISRYKELDFRLETSIVGDRNNGITIEQTRIANSRLSKEEGETRSATSADVRQRNVDLAYDDEHKVYRRGDDLIENNTFTKNGFVFCTDSEGRVRSASGKISVNKEPRNLTDKILVVGKGDERDTDDRGHLIGHQLNGPDGLENLVAQDQHINRGSYLELEIYLREKLEAGNEVFVSVSPMYDKLSNRPEGIYYYYSVDGIGHFRWFQNVNMEETK